ncbi:MAG: NAD(P)-dependent oxidoreductase [Magnetococcus sp. YQC-5]
MSKYLITGAHGFIGRHLVGKIRAKQPDAEIVSTVHRRSFDPGQSADSIRVDLSDPAAIDLHGDWETIFHLAALIPDHHDDDNSSLLNKNIQIALGMLEICRSTRPRKLVVASSIAVYPPETQEILHESLPIHPVRPYGIGKACAEHILSHASACGTEVVFLRLSSIYGLGMPSNTVLSLFITQASKGLPLTLFGNGNRIQDFVYIDDVVDAFLLASQDGIAGVCNIGSGQSSTMLQLAEEIARQEGWRTTIRFAPDVIDTAANVRVDISKASLDIGYRPVYDLAKGINAYHALLSGHSSLPGSHNHNTPDTSHARFQS